MFKTLTSRERMIRAINRQEVDYVPCAFMSFAAMRARCQDAYELVDRELAMGLDSMLFVPTSWRHERRNHPDLRGLPVRFPPEVTTELWIEEIPGERFPVLHKEYHTPAGTLTTLVRKTDDWPHGNFVPFVDDYQVPRAIKPLVTTRADLDALQAMLMPPTPEEIAAFRAEMERARAFSADRGVLIAGGWGVGADMAAWLCGLENMMFMMMDQPQLLKDLLAIIAAWNEQRMRVILEAGVDLFIRRAWYESADFWSPRLYREFLLPILKREVALAHEYETPFGYIMTSGVLPMLDHVLEAGVDVLLGVGPLQHGSDAPLQVMRDKLGGRVCLWGGVNGAITIEQGSADDVREAVACALETMRGVNGFILSPVDNITEITLHAWRNVNVFVETWKQLR